MQVIRQSVATAIQRSTILVRPSLMVQQIRFDGSDPRSSTSSDSHKEMSTNYIGTCSVTSKPHPKILDPTDTIQEQKPSERQSNSVGGKDLNKSKGGDKKQRSTTTDDTKQPGTTRKDWSKPNQVVGNDPPYGKAGGSTDAHNPNQGKN